jgi:mannitol/fructose-specific phosphotransferase system IIA component (Ntr-type)/phage FluMu protein Com
MPVPFWPEVAAKSVEILTDPRYAEAVRMSNPRFEASWQAALDELTSEFPKAHPIALDEHLCDAARLIQEAVEQAQAVREGTVTPEAAFRALTREFSYYYSMAPCRRALAYAIGQGDPRSLILPCPHCRQLLRVPTNRGALTLTCPRCRTRWDWMPPQNETPGEPATRTTPPVAEPRADRARPGGWATEGPMKFSEFVVREAILTDLQATTKEESIREMVRSLHQAGALAEPDLASITRAILEVGSTAVTVAGAGAAFPELRHPAVDRLIGTIALLRRGVEFDTQVGEPVDLLFLVISPPNKVRELWDAREVISRLVIKNECFRNRLRQARTREQVIALLDEADREADRAGW